MTKIWIFKHNNKIVQVEEIGWGEVIMHTSPTERVRTTWKEVDKLRMEYVTTVRSLKAPLSFNGRYEQLRIRVSADELPGVLAGWLFLKILFWSIIGIGWLFVFTLDITWFFLKEFWKLIKWICRMIVFLVVYFKEKRNGKSN